MTGPERAELRDIREEMRAGFAEMREGFALVNGRVKRLEVAEAVISAVGSERNRIAVEQRWRIGLLTGVLASVGVGFLNFFLR